MAYRNENPDWICRHLVRSREKAVVATVMRDTPGDPYASLVLTASDHQGNPLIYISDLAEHTKNIWQNNRGSMLFEKTAGLNDPLSGARVTLQGSFEECKDETLLERYFKRHEQSRKYSSAHSFFLYRMKVERAHLVAGFGRIYWLNADEYFGTTGECTGLADAEHGIVTHMNEDHSDALDLIATRLLGFETEGWTLTGMDAEGFDMRHRDQVARYDFAAPLASAADTRPVMVDLVNEARAATPEPTEAHAEPMTR